MGEAEAKFLAVSGLQFALCKAKLGEKKKKKGGGVCIRQLVKKGYVTLLGVVTNPLELGPPNSAT